MFSKISYFHEEEIETVNYENIDDRSMTRSNNIRENSDNSNLNYENIDRNSKDNNDIHEINTNTNKFEDEGKIFFTENKLFILLVLHTPNYYESIKNGRNIEEIKENVRTQPRVHFQSLESEYKNQIQMHNTYNNNNTRNNLNTNKTEILSNYSDSINYVNVNPNDAMGAITMKTEQKGKICFIKKYKI